MVQKILVVAAHPDDEVLGVGATIAKHFSSGDEVSVCILGEGSTSRYEKGVKNKNELDKLRECSLRASKILGIKDVFFSDLPDNRFDAVDLLDVVKIIEEYIFEIKPDIIYTHHGGDLNIDHRIVFNAVMTATRPCNNEKVERILCFETPSSTEWNAQLVKNTFLPNVYLDVSRTFDKKIQAIKVYTTEIRDYPHPRSVEALEALSMKRGVEAGLKLAEAFMLVREIS